MADEDTQDTAADTGADTGTQDTSSDTTQTDDTAHGDESVEELRARLNHESAERKRLQREAAEREKDRRKAQREAQAAEEQRRAQQGEWEQLAKERADRIAELEGQITERDRLEQERQRRSRVEDVADRLNFLRPKRVYALLRDDGVEDEVFDSEQLLEAALRRLAKNERELVDQQRRSGAPVNGRSGSQATPQDELREIVGGLLGPPQPR